MNASEEILVDRIAHRAAAHRGDRALLVAVSGIDGSGKTTIARRVADGLGARAIAPALIGLDPWHHPASRRFGSTDPGRHFYRHAFRFEELFGRVYFPAQRFHLRRDRPRSFADLVVRNE